MMRRRQAGELGLLALYTILVVGIPLLWVTLCDDVPRINHFYVADPWNRVLLIEPPVAWWSILAMSFGQGWLERNVGLTYNSNFAIMKYVAIVTMAGIPVVLLFAAHYR
jgi:hypothetical protein